MSATYADPKLVEWINTHDCGVSPTAIIDPEDPATILIRIQEVHGDGRITIATERARTYADARAHLGY